MSTEYTREIADEICRRLAEGVPLTEICRDEAMPLYSTVVTWARTNEDGFRARMSQALLAGLDKQLRGIDGNPPSGTHGE